jgi:translation elongation factor EF-G
VIDVEVFLNHFELGRGTSEVIIEAAAAACVRQCLQSAVVSLLEPIVSLEITVDERFQHVVVDDLNRRRFLMEGVDVRHGNKVRKLRTIAFVLKGEII